MNRKRYFLPNTYITHFYGRSSIKTNARQTVYYESYYKYFKKHHGTGDALIIKILIFLGESIRLLIIQFKYFPIGDKRFIYGKKIKSSLNLLLWIFGFKETLKKSLFRI
jgi:hypothetical protein